jgi:hypothetical protein
MMLHAAVAFTASEDETASLSPAKEAARAIARLD